MFRNARPYKVLIRYKSGYSVTIRCKSFKSTRRTDGSLEVQWHDARPKPLLIGVDEIESVFQLSGF